MTGAEGVDRAALQRAKVSLRREMIARRAAIEPEARAQASARIAAQIEATRAFREAKTIALYAAFGSEADPLPLEAAALSRGARVLYPRLDGDALAFIAVRRAALAIEPLARYPIPSPARDAPAVAPAEIDLFIVPGLAFTRDGKRLGYGRGYYDRALHAARASSTSRDRAICAIGFAFAAQLAGDLPATPEDESLEAIATELQLFIAREAAVIV